MLGCLFMQAFAFTEKEVIKISDAPISQILKKSTSIYLTSFDSNIYKYNTTQKKLISNNLEIDWLKSLQFWKEKLVVASTKGQVAIVDYNLNKITENSLHQWWVSDILVENSKIITVSYDGKIKKTDPKTFVVEKEAHIVLGSPRPQKVKLIDNKYFVVANKTKVLVYNQNLHEVNRLELGYYYDVAKSISANKEYIVIGLTNSKFVLFSKALKKIKEIDLGTKKQTIMDMVFQGKKIFLATSKGSLYCYDIKEDSLKKVYQHKNYAIRALLYENNQLLIGTDDGYLKVLQE